MQLSTRCMLSLALAVLPAACLAEQPAPEAAKSAPASSPTIKRPSWGRVVGWVVDASTRKAIPQAAVSLELRGEFPSSGKGTARTDQSGRFVSQAPLGRISSNVDWGRVLTMHPFSLLFSPRAMMRETRIVDVDRMNVRVTAPGYKPFFGSVNAADIHPDGYSLRLEDVWLAPAGGKLTSFSPDNLQHESIDSLTASPTICAPGDTVTVTLVAQLPLDRKFHYRAFLKSNNPRLIATDQPLKEQKPASPSQVVFSRAIKVPVTPGEPYAELGFYLIRNGQTTLVEPETKVMVQSASTPERKSAAQRIDEGYRLARRGELDAALQRYAAARAADPKYTLAHLFYGDLCLKLGKSAQAVEAFQRLVALSPEDWDVARPRHILALMQDGQINAAAQEAKQADQKNRKVPPAILLYQARIAALQGRFDDADKALAKAAQFIKIPVSTQREINLHRMQLATSAHPDDAELRLTYARVLGDAHRWDEAVAEIQRAVRLAPRDPWAYLDLANALRQAGRAGESAAPLARALDLDPTNSEARLMRAEALRDQGDYAGALTTYQQLAAEEKNNVRARHGCALMLLQERRLPDARQELAEVVQQTRAKGETEDLGLMMPMQSIYFGPKKRFVSGYSLPEGAADNVILDCLDDLDSDPRNALAWANIGGALVQLSVPRMALSALDRAAALDNSLLEVRYYRGLALRELGDRSGAEKELAAVVAANPLHPRARLELARLLSERGDLDDAQVQVLAHARNYPDERRTALTP